MNADKNSRNRNASLVISIVYSIEIHLLGHSWSAQFSLLMALMCVAKFDHSFSILGPILLVFVTAVAGLNCLAEEPSTDLLVKKECTELAKPDAKPAQQIQLNRIEVARALRQIKVETIGQSVTVRATQAELLDSEFFIAVLQEASRRHKGELGFDFSDSKKLALLNRPQTDQAAIAIYETMEDIFLNKGDLISSLSNPRLSWSTFSDLSKAELVDKIGETLIISGHQLEFYDLAAAVVKHQEASDLEAGSIATGLIGTLVTGLIFILDYSFESSVSRTVLFDSLAWQVSFGSSLASFIGPMASFSLRYDRAPRVLFQKRLSSRAALGEVHTVDRTLLENAGIDQVKVEELRARLEAIRSRGRAPNLRNLNTFGSDAVALHRELNAEFHGNFMKWMEIYERNRDRVKSKLRSLREGRLSSSEVETNVLSFLAKMLQEASETTWYTSELSFVILEVIEQDLNSLKAMQIDINNQFIYREYTRRLDFLRLAYATYGQFVATLDPIHKLISDLLYSVETLTLADAAAMNADLSSRTSEINGSNGLDAVLRQLDEMDQLLVALREPTHSRQGQVILPPLIERDCSDPNCSDLD